MKQRYGRSRAKELQVAAYLLDLKDCLFGYWRCFSNLSEQYISVCIGVSIHSMSVHTSDLARKRKREKWKGRWRNIEGRTKKEEEEKEEKRRKEKQ
ncbi:hypothetical protein C4D60_Mb05t27970 [Musa balbisiana]|uniref:Uncharacterized protein n=1 Tax=Musa balbisiana TaxID=52838 RepID=A0A4S8JZI2_MUSBA|nr:hypothetical protein C4D60_Mb05t27970 [Musa balbisiana]